VVELKGSLSSVGLSAVVQLIGELHHSGTLHLARDHQSGQLTFEDGRLVAAERGDIHGLQAIAACAVDLAEAEFNFVEGEPATDQTLDVSPTELKRIIGRVTSAHVPGPVNGRTNGASHDRTETVCPLLGFADDRGRHYARPTALHRCYASQTPSLISSVEQHELCLSDGFAACPRFQAHNAPQVASAPAEDIPSPAPPPASPRAANQARVPPPQRVEPPTRNTARRSRFERFVRRDPLVLAGGVIVGLITALLLVVFAVLRRPAAPVVADPVVPTVAIAVAGAAVSQQPTVAVVQQPTVALRPTTLTTTTTTTTTAPVVVPTPTAPPRVPTPAAVAQPAAAAPVAPPGTPLLDLRFAAGPEDDWVENQPYAGWSDGAYRLNARDATRFVAVGVPVDQTFGDVIVSATFRKTGGPPGGGYGLIVHDQGPPPRDGVNQQFNGYVLEASDTGEFGIWRRDGDHFVDLVPWTQSERVRSGGSPNDLSVRAIGDRLSFILNGVEVASAEDSTLADGGIGIFVGGDDNEVALDRFNVTVPLTIPQ
jgi:hypothetical protein